MRRAARFCLSLLLIGSLCLTAINAWRISQSWPASLFVSRTAAELSAALDRALARTMTPERLNERYAQLLAQTPRNWLAIEGVEALAADRGLEINAALRLHREMAWDADSGWWAGTKGCATCMYDARSCTPNLLLFCAMPASLTPIGDVAGVVRGGVTWMSGGEVDVLDFGLSAVGLTAVILVLPSGGSGALIKAGAGFLKLVRKAGRLPEGLARILRRALTDGFDWHRIGSVRSADDLAGLARPAVLRPAFAIFTDTKLMLERIGPAATLHIIPLADSPATLRTFTAISRVAGFRMVGALEVLGKSRLLRIARRYADEVWWAITGIVGLALSALGMIASLIGNGILRGLRRAARSNDRPSAKYPRGRHRSP